MEKDDFLCSMGNPFYHIIRPLGSKHLSENSNFMLVGQAIVLDRPEYYGLRGQASKSIRLMFSLLAIANADRSKGEAGVSGGTLA